MGSTQDSQQTRPPVSAVPDSVGAGTTLLLCSFEPTDEDICLRILSQFGSGSDSGVIVTPIRGAESTIKAYTTRAETTVQPSISIVDTVSQHQSISAMYDTVPTVFTPSAGDLERLVIALSELTGTVVPADGERHLVIPSLSPLLGKASADQISDILQRITGLRTTGGFGIFGLDYTAHDTSTVATVASAVERVLWVTKQPDGEFSFELRSTRADFEQLSIADESGT